MISTFDKSKSGAILGVIGCGNLMYTAAVATVNGDNFQKKSNTDSLYNFESAGRTLCGVTVYTFSTPAGSFFVPTVESWGKSQDLIHRRLELCNTVLHTATDNRSSLLVQSSRHSHIQFKRQSAAIRLVQSLWQQKSLPKKSSCSITSILCRFRRVSAWKSAVFSLWNTSTANKLKPSYL